jgi:hypothetical protein
MCRLIGGAGLTMNRKDHPQRNHESGQVLVLVALSMLGLIATLGLVLDGGNIYLQRRRMQNAADAGSLAGARILALGGTTADAEMVARNYAEERNAAESSDISFDEEAEVITVLAHTNAEMTFAQVLGLEQVPVTARASASYDGVCTAGKMTLAPIAIKNLPFEDFDPERPDETTYYIWDDPVEEGPDPLSSNNIAGNNRSWLTMYCHGYGLPEDIPECANCGASTLTDWMLNGYNQEFPIGEKQWVRGDNGVKNRPVAITEARIGDILIIPLYDEPDPGDPIEGDAIQEIHPGKAYYHINDAECFLVTAVIATGNPKGIEGHFLPSCVIAGAPGCESVVKTVFLTE